MTVRHYAYDPTLAPSGKTSLVVILETEYDWWADLVRDSDRYATEKRRVADTVRAILQERFGALLDRVEQVDVATPLTWERFSGNWRGAYEGWLPTRGAMLRSLSGGLRRTLPRLEGFYMVGQWVVPGGGLPGVAPAARALIQRLCAEDGLRFVTCLATPATEHPRLPFAALTDTYAVVKPGNSDLAVGLARAISPGQRPPAVQASPPARVQRR